jgi:hypothetical protein
MSLDLARIQVEVLEPGAVIVGKTNIPLYLNPPRPFFSWPEKPVWELGHALDAIVIKEMTARLHIQTMGTGMDLITLGDLDFLLTLHSEQKLFEPWLGEWVAMAVREVRPKKGYRKWCKIAAFDVDVDIDMIKLAGWLPEGDKLRMLLSRS